MARCAFAYGWILAEKMRRGLSGRCDFSKMKESGTRISGEQTEIVR